MNQKPGLMHWALGKADGGTFNGANRLELCQ